MILVSGTEAGGQMHFGNLQGATENQVGIDYGGAVILTETNQEILNAGGGATST